MPKSVYMNPAVWSQEETCEAYADAIAYALRTWGGNEVGWWDSPEYEDIDDLLAELDPFFGGCTATANYYPVARGPLVVESMAYEYEHDGKSISSSASSDDEDQSAWPATFTLNYGLLPSNWLCGPSAPKAKVLYM
jgi:hypothetical protein